MKAHRRLTATRALALALLALGIGPALAAEPWPVKCPDSTLCVASRAQGNSAGSLAVLELGWQYGRPIMLLVLPGADFGEIGAAVAPIEVDGRPVDALQTFAERDTILWYLSPAATVALAKGRRVLVHVGDAELDLSLTGSAAALAGSLRAAAKVAQEAPPPPKAAPVTTARPEQWL